MRLTIGTRGSWLALAQANWVADRVREAHSGALVDLEIIKTQGEVAPDRPISSFSDKGLFTREIESALLEGWIDCAVHSLKDLSTEEPPGTCIMAVPEREDARDALIVPGITGCGNALEVLLNLPEGAVVGTSSNRRKYQLLRKRPDLEIREIRGNIDTRLRKLEEGQYDAIVVAAAGFNRLGLGDRLSGVFEVRDMVPAPGQAALGIQARDDDTDAREALSPLEHWATRQAVTAERAFLAALGGGCRAPIAAFGDVVGHNMELTGFLAGEDGSRPVFGRLNANSNEPVWVGRKLARKLQPTLF